MGAIATTLIVLFIVFVGLLIFIPIAENDISKSVTGITLDDITKTITKTTSQTETTQTKVSLRIDEFCNAIYPNGFQLPENNEQALSGCWTVETLQAHDEFGMELMIPNEGCVKRILLNGENHTYCFADGALEPTFPGGTTLAKAGIGFIQNWCDMGNTWAICSGSLAPPILSFLP